MSNTINSGLSLTVPDFDETGWYTMMQAVWLAISAHNHDSSSNRGAQIGTSGIATNAVTDAVLRLRNNQSLRARNAGDSADVNLLKLNASNVLDFQTVSIFSSSESPTNSGALSLTTMISILNGASLAMTLAAGTDGQFKVVVNKHSSVATVTPTPGPAEPPVLANTISLVQNGVAMFWYIDSGWRVIPGPGCTVTDDSTTITAAGAANIDVTTKNIIANYAGGATKTLNPGVEGQIVDIVNINAANAVFVGSTTLGVNQATLVQYGSVRYNYLSGEWRALAGPGCTLA